MKTLENKKLTTAEGLPIQDENKKQFTTLSLVQTVLMNSQYENSAGILQASKILGGLKEIKGKFELEDADYAVVKGLVSKYEPFLKLGLVFVEFYKQFEN